MLSDGLLDFVKKHERIQSWYTPEQASAIGLMIDAWTTRESGFCNRVADCISKKGRRSRLHMHEPVSLDQGRDEFDVDEAKVPYSAWALHQTTATRVLAATRYMEELALQGKGLSEDGMLGSAAKVEALTLLSEGGKVKEEVGKRFMIVYKELEAKEEALKEKGSSLKGRGRDHSAEVDDNEGFWAEDEDLYSESDE